MTSPFGKPSDVQVRSTLSTVVAQPAGAQRGTTPLNQPIGSALSGENYIVRDGALELRPALSTITGVAGETSAWDSRGPVGGGFELQNVLGKRYAMSFHSDQYIYYDETNADWVQGSIGTGGGAGKMRGNQQTRWDLAQIYLDTVDDNVVVAVSDAQQSLFYARPIPQEFGTLTNLIGAKRVATFDNYVLAANIFESASTLTFPQRVQWSDRGSASSWTGGLSGFEDLLAARGEIQRIIALENRVIVFFDDETWQGLPSDYPFTFRFSPIDQGIGCPYPWTATVTPQGVVFMARDFQVYLLPKAGGQPTPIGSAIQRKIRSDITWPDRAFSVYDPNMQQYEMFYCASTDSYPRNAAFMDINSGAWSFQSFPVYLTAGFAAHERPDRSNAVIPMLASSQGTMYYLNSSYTRDAVSGTTPAISAYWEFMPFGGDGPAAQKSIMEVRVDYDAPSASSLTVRTSPSNGDSFSAGVGLSLRTTSVVSQDIAYVQEASRYPVVRLEQESQRQRIHRAFVTARIGGR